MHRRSVTRLAAAAILGLVTVIPANLAQTDRAQAAGTIVTMYAGPNFTPYGGKIDTQHPHAITALKVLADQFQKQTGITIKFVNPAIGSSASTNNYPSWNTYMQASVTANTAPDVVDAPQGIGISQLGWFQDLTSALSKPNPFVSGNKRWQDEYSTLMLTYPEGNGGILASDKKYYEIPIQASYPYIIIGTFYNKAALAKAGITAPPTTWEAWMQQLGKLKAAGIAAMSPNTGENKSGSIWPLWSTLCAPFTENLALKLDPKDKGVMSNLTESQFIVSGAINMKDPRMQAPWLQYKRQAGYYLPGWNAADIETAWTQGKMAERYGGFWEIPIEMSNPGIKFKWGFFAPVPVTTATSPLADGKYTMVPTGQAARIAKAPYSAGVGVVANAVQRDNNLDAAVKWLQFISAPQADEFIVNENVTGIPAVTGAHMAPSYNVLNNTPVPNYQAQIFPYQMYNAEYLAVTHESVIWLLDQESDASFFGHIQNIITQYAKQTIADNAKKK